MPFSLVVFSVSLFAFLPVRSISASLDLGASPAASENDLRAPPPAKHALEEPSPRLVKRQEGDLTVPPNFYAVYAASFSPKVQHHKGGSGPNVLWDSDECGL